MHYSRIMISRYSSTNVFLFFCFFGGEGNPGRFFWAFEHHCPVAVCQNTMMSSPLCRDKTFGTKWEKSPGLQPLTFKHLGWTNLVAQLKVSRLAQVGADRLERIPI